MSLHHWFAGTLLAMFVFSIVALVPALLWRETLEWIEWTWKHRPIVLLLHGTAFIAFFVLFTWLGAGMAYKDEQDAMAFDYYRQQYHCEAVDQRTEYYHSYPAQTRTETKTLWRCDNGEFWR